MTLEESYAGTAAPPEIVRSLQLIKVEYVGFDGATHHGHLLIAADLAKEVHEIFHILLEAKFPIAKMKPIVAYGWDDDASMRDNNCSAFNYRVIAGTARLSHHATGHAIDINPLQNPYIVKGLSIPPGLVYEPRAKGAVVDGDIVVRTFLAHGWQWGGHWNPHDADAMIDYQHFQKVK